MQQLNSQVLMKRIHLSYLITLVLLVFTYHQSVFSQSSGYIVRPATNAAGRLVLDPNGDGYTSATTAGFGGDDVSQSEIPYKSIRSYSIEPFGDLRRGANHGYSDFVPDTSGNGVYHYFSAAQQVQFRMRLGSISPGSKGYSIMMDTDGKFGATGANADPNYLPATTGTNGNPGFEIEVVLETNFRIAIYNVDGTSTPVLVKQYTNWQDMSQVSIASTNDNGDPDFLIDFYIPFSDLQAAPFNLTTASPIRMTATTVMAPQAAIGGPRSDIYGVSGDTYEDMINGQPACTVFNTAASCPATQCTAAPSVNTPINTGTVNITGTWTKSALTGASGVATITVYKNGVVIGTVSNVASGASWSLNSISLINGDVINAKAQAVGESMCLTSNSVAASTCNSSNTPVAPVLTCTSGSKGLEGTNLSTGWRVHVDNITRGVFDNSVSNSTGLFGAPSGTSPNITWQFSGGCSSGAPLTSGSYKVYYVNIATGCASAPSYFCAPGNGGTALAGTLAVPVITAPSGSLFTTATKTISGTTDPNATVFLYINNTLRQTTTANGSGSFTFSGLNLLNGQQLFLVVELNTGTVSTSKCANRTTAFTVSCYTQPPLINADNNGQLTSGAPLTGTSTEPAGTLVRVYTATNTLVATTAVQANGSWSTGNAGTTPGTYNAVAGTSYYANAQNGTCGVSGNSATYAAASQTAATRCGTITGPVSSGAASVSGTLTGSFTSTTVNLYLDGELIGSASTNTAAWGPIAVNTTAGNTLYSNGILSIGIRESGKQEVSCPASATTISCSPTPSAPSFTPANASINQYQTVTYTISNAAAGSFYAIADSSGGRSLGQGKWAAANGSITVTTDPFNVPGTYKLFLKSTSLSGVTLCSAVSSYGVVTVNMVTLPVQLIDFTGHRNGDRFLLSWTTAAEVNLDHFEVERSSNGQTFTQLGIVAGTGGGTGTTAYQFPDNQPLNARSYYRLKIVDADGSFVYSPVLTFKGLAAAATGIALTAPNPFTDQLGFTLTLESSLQVQSQLLDLNGRVVASRSLQGQPGSQRVQWNGLSFLPEGFYFLQVHVNGMTFREKVVKLK